MKQKQSLEQSQIQSPLLIPTYMKSFECIGSACEDTCCAGWTVRIDRPSYLKYRNIGFLSLQKKLDDHLVQRPEPSADERFYAYFQTDSDQRCPMLDPDLLCSIQRTAGEPYLSAVCANFPRMFNRNHSELEMSGDVACPEIARLALLNPDGISFERLQTSIDPWRHTPEADGRAASPETTGQSFNVRFREEAIDLLQNRSLAWDLRMKRFVKAKTVLSERLLERGELLETDWEAVFRPDTDQTNGIPLNDITDSDAVLALISGLLESKALLDLRLSLGAIQDRFATCYAAILYGAGFLPETQSSELQVAQLTAAYHAVYQPYLRNNSYLIENDLVNWLFQHPIHLEKVAEPDGEDAFLLFLARYQLIRFGLIAMAACYGELTDELTLKWIQSLSKTTGHHRGFRQHMIQFGKTKASLFS